MVTELRLHEESSGERGPSEPEAEGANRRASQIAGDKAELTEATNTVRARRRLQNRRETMASGGGTPWAHAQSKREGKGARLKAQLSGEGQVSVGGLQKKLGRVRA